MKKTILQTITDLMESAGVPVLGIDTYPPNEEGEINVSLRVRPAVNSGVDVDAFIADEEKAAPVGEPPCSTCNDPDCENCPINQNNGDPIKLYTPEEARKAMQAGKVLKDKKGRIYYFGKFIETHDGKIIDHGIAFWYGYENKTHSMIIDFPPDLFSEESHPQTDPIKRYTPEEAVKAMLTGKVLRNKKGYEFYWGFYNGELSFWFWVNEDHESYNTVDFSGLYSDGWITPIFYKNAEGVICVNTKSD